TQAVVMARATTMPRIGCHQGMPGGTARRATISIGVAGGKNENHVEKVLLGCSITWINTNIGNTASRITGISMVWLSDAVVQAAPMAMKMDPNIRIDSTKNVRNQARSGADRRSAKP